MNTNSLIVPTKTTVQLLSIAALTLGLGMLEVVEGITPDLKRIEMRQFEFSQEKENDSEEDRDKLSWWTVGYALTRPSNEVTRSDSLWEGEGIYVSYSRAFDPRHAWQFDATITKADFGRDPQGEYLGGFGGYWTEGGRSTMILMSLSIKKLSQRTYSIKEGTAFGYFRAGLSYAILRNQTAKFQDSDSTFKVLAAQKFDGAGGSVGFGLLSMFNNTVGISLEVDLENYIEWDGYTVYNTLKATGGIILVLR